MEIGDLLAPRSVIANLRVSNKKQAIQELAKRAATATGVVERRIFEVLSERERLGTTGIGMGIAIPHGKMPEITSVKKAFRLTILRSPTRQRWKQPLPFPGR